MTSRLALLALLVGCVPKAGTTTAAVSATPTPVEAAPAPAPVDAPVTPASPVGATDPAALTGAAVEPPSAAESRPRAVARQVNEAAAMLTTGDQSRAQRALEVLQAQVTENPDVAAIHYNIGVAHQILGQEAEARRAWTRATEVDPTFAKAWLNLGVISMSAGRTDLALASFQAGSRYAPDSVDLRVATISGLRQLRRFDEAIAEAKAALGINSKAIPVYNELALVYLDTKQFDLARFTLQKAQNDIDGAKGNARLYAVLGEVYYRLDYSGDAVQSFQKALELDPYQLPALLYLAGYHMDNRSWTDATPLLERAAKIVPKDGGVQLNLGISYRGEGRFEDAKKAYLEALRLSPSNPEPHRNLGVLYGDYMKAYDAALQSIEDYRRAGGKPADEIDAWVASIKKEQKKVEDKRRRDDERLKREQDERKKEDEAAIVPAAPAPDQTPVTPPAPGQPAPVPAPSPDPGGAPAPTPAPAPQPEPAGDGSQDPWGG
ncbi:MAG: tetratricopeptide repeat protein [Pseudomonadota bacterium]|nr:tetratricopeptide repeat protein [Pseudomonadota bacterium]